MEHNTCFELFLNAKDKINSLHPDYSSALEELNKIEERSITMCIEHMKMICLFMLNRQEDIIEYFYTHKAEVLAYCSTNEELRKILAATFYTCGMKRKANEFYAISPQYETSSFDINYIRNQQKSAASFQVNHSFLQLVKEVKQARLLNHTIVERPCLEEISPNESLEEDYNPSNNKETAGDKKGNDTNSSLNSKEEKIKKSKTFVDQMTNTDPELLHQKADNPLNQTQVNYNKTDLLNSVNKETADPLGKVEENDSNDTLINDKSNKTDKESDQLKKSEDIEKGNDKECINENNKSQEVEIKHVLSNVSIPKPRSDRETILAGNQLATKKTGDKKASYDDKSVTQKSQPSFPKNEAAGKKNEPSQNQSGENFDDIQLLPNSEVNETQEIKHAKTETTKPNKKEEELSLNDNPESLRSQQEQPVKKRDDSNEAEKEKDNEKEFIDKSIKEKGIDTNEEKEPIKEQAKEGEMLEDDHHQEKERSNTEKNDQKETSKDLSLFEDRIKSKEDKKQSETHSLNGDEIAKKEENKDLSLFEDRVKAKEDMELINQKEVMDFVDEVIRKSRTEPMNAHELPIDKQEAAEVKNESIDKQSIHSKEDKEKSLIDKQENNEPSDSKKGVQEDHEAEKEKTESVDQIKVNALEVSELKDEKNKPIKQEEDLSNNPPESLKINQAETTNDIKGRESNRDNQVNNTFELEIKGKCKEDTQLKEKEESEKEVLPKSTELKELNEKIEESKPEDNINKDKEEKSNQPQAEEKEQIPQQLIPSEEEAKEREEEEKVEASAAIKLENEIMKSNPITNSEEMKKEEDADEFNLEGDEGVKLLKEEPNSNKVIEVKADSNSDRIGLNQGQIQLTKDAENNKQPEDEINVGEQTNDRPELANEKKQVTEEEVKKNEVLQEHKDISQPIEEEVKPTEAQVKEEGKEEEQKNQVEANNDEVNNKEIKNSHPDALVNEENEAKLESYKVNQRLQEEVADPINTSKEQLQEDEEDNQMITKQIQINPISSQTQNNDESIKESNHDLIKPIQTTKYNYDEQPSTSIKEDANQQPPDIKPEESTLPNPSSQKPSSKEIETPSSSSHPSFKDFSKAKTISNGFNVFNPKLKLEKFNGSFENAAKFLPKSKTNVVHQLPPKSPSKSNPSKQKD